MSEMTENEIISQFSQLNYAKLRKLIIKDLNSSYSASSILLKKYSRDSIIKYLESPDKNEKPLQEMSEFLYNVSPYYKRLIDYMSELTTDNYWLSPMEREIPNLDSFQTCYLETAKKYSRYSFKTINPQIRKEVFLKGIYYGICFESKDSFCLKKLDVNYCKISSIEDGSLFFSFDLDYFNSKAHFALIKEYGNDFVKAYRRYKGDPELGIPADKTQRWFEPKNQICVKLDPSVTEYALPYFMGLFSAILEIDIYKEIKKDGAILDNYKVLAMQMATDENGVPTMSFEKAKQYYDHAAQNLPEGVGLIMSPFKMDDFSLRNTGTTDDDIAENATKQFWANAGVNPLLFGIGSNPTSATLELGIRTDEAIVFYINSNIAKSFNTIYKKTNPDYMFNVVFVDQTLFNKTTLIDSLTKGGSYGLPVKSMLLAAHGLEPFDVLTMSYLEDITLGFTDKMLRTPLLQSSTMSPDNEEGGRPTNESKGLGTSDNTQLGEDNNTENR